MYVGAEGGAGEHGQLSVTGADSTFFLEKGVLTVGASSVSTGEVLVEDSGKIVLGGAEAEVHINPTGMLILDPFADFILGDGTLTVDGGTVDAVDSPIEFGDTGEVIVQNDGVWDGPLLVTGGFQRLRRRADRGR